MVVDLPWLVLTCAHHNPIVLGTWNSVLLLCFNRQTSVSVDKLGWLVEKKQKKMVITPLLQSRVACPIRVFVSVHTPAGVSSSWMLDRAHHVTYCTEARVFLLKPLVPLQMHQCAGWMTEPDRLLLLPSLSPMRLWGFAGIIDNTEL
jgi:hypothetical protein